MGAHNQVKDLLDKLPLSTRQRELYERGLRKMSDIEAVNVVKDLEASLVTAGPALEGAKNIIQRHSTRRALVITGGSNAESPFVATLKSKGLEVEAVADASAAISSYENTPADVVIVDIAIPASASIMFARRIHAVNVLLNRQGLCIMRTQAENPEILGQISGYGTCVFVASGTSKDWYKFVRGALDTFQNVPKSASSPLAEQLRHKG